MSDLGPLAPLRPSFTERSFSFAPPHADDAESFARTLDRAKAEERAELRSARSDREDAAATSAEASRSATEGRPEAPATASGAPEAENAPAHSGSPEDGASESASNGAESRSDEAEAAAADPNADTGDTLVVKPADPATLAVFVATVPHAHALSGAALGSPLAAPSPIGDLANVEPDPAAIAPAVPAAIAVPGAGASAIASAQDPGASIDPAAAVDPASLVAAAASGLAPKTTDTAALQAAFAQNGAEVLPDTALALQTAAPTAGPAGIKAPSRLAADPAATTIIQAGSGSPASATLQVQARFIERFDGRAQRFEVRLDPAELGRVDISIEIGADKRVHAVLAAHDGAALNDLIKGSRALEQALSDAGIDLAEGGLSFQLASRDGDGQPARDQTDSDWARREALAGSSLVDVPVEPDLGTLAYAARSYALGRLNIIA